MLGGFRRHQALAAALLIVAGIPITDLMDKATIDRSAPARVADSRSRSSSDERISALGASAVEMVEAILLDKKKILPCSVFLKVSMAHDLLVGVLWCAGARGLEQIIEITPTPRKTPRSEETGSGRQGTGNGDWGVRRVDRSKEVNARGPVRKNGIAEQADQFQPRPEQATDVGANAQTRRSRVKATLATCRRSGRLDIPRVMRAMLRWESPGRPLRIRLVGATAEASASACSIMVTTAVAFDPTLGSSAR